MKRRITASLILASVVFAGRAEAAIEKPRFTVCDATTIFLLSQTGGRWEREAYEVEVWKRPKELGEDPSQAVPVREATGPAVRLATNPPVLRVDLDAPLKPDALYLVRVRTLEGVRVAEGDLDTASRAMIARSGAGVEANAVLDVTSIIHLRKPDIAELDLIEVRSKTGDIPARLHHARVLTPPVDQDCKQVDDPERLATMTLGLTGVRGLRSDSVGLELKGLTNVFGQTVRTVGDLAPAAAPKGKEDAFAYGRVSFESAKGVPDSFAVDLKVKPRLAQIGRVLFRPELAAAIAKNVPGASNSIRVAGLLSQTTERREGAILYHTFSYGPALESDRGFDRVNGLADLRWQPVFRGFNRSREIQRIAEAAALGRRPEEVALHDFGWGLETWLGLEAGGSLSRQTVTSGQREIEVDRYDVLRLRPLVHGFLEYRRFTLDLTSNLRYLAAEELAARRAADGSLSIEEVEGFEPFTEATLSYAFDPAKHFSLGLTWKDGAEPPLFVDVEKCSVGLVVKY